MKKAELIAKIMQLGMESDGGCQVTVETKAEEALSLLNNWLAFNRPKLSKVDTPPYIGGGFFSDVDITIPTMQANPLVQVSILMTCETCGGPFRTEDEWQTFCEDCRPEWVNGFEPKEDGT